MKRFLRFLNSIRLKCFILLFCSLLLPVGVVSYGFLHLFEDRAVQSDISSLTDQAKLLTNQIVTTGYMADPSLSFLNAELTALGNAYRGRIMVINSSLRVIRDTYGVDEGKTVVWENVVRAAKGETNSYVDRVSHYLIVAVPIEAPSPAEEADSLIPPSVSRSGGGEDDGQADAVLGSEEGPVGVLLLIKSSEYIIQNRDFITRVLIEALLIVLIFATVLSIFFSARISAGFSRIRKGILSVQEGRKEEVKVRGSTEERDLALAFNTYHAGMKDQDQSRSEFVSNVSHELKTPLASMKVLADSINSMGGNAPIEVYRDFMGDITGEIDRETKIINDLLSLVRMDKSGVSLNISKVNLNEMMETLLKRLRPLAEKSEVDLVLESFRPVTAEVDEVKLSLALMNLVENGIKYNHPGGYVHVSLNADHEYFFVKVEDNGIGIPKDSLNRIFERFYRVDKSHSREIGGTGLGLAITHNAILLHHGEIKVSSKEGEGTVFDVRVPLKFIEKGEEV